MTEPANPLPVVDLQPISSATTPKPGYLTTEFYGAWAAKILGALLTSGLLADGSIAMRITGAAVFVLAQLGYTWSRTAVKAAAMLLIVGMLAPAQMACGSTPKSIGKAALADAIDCTTPDRVKLEAQFGPTVELALQRAMGLDGKIDVPSLKQITGSLEADGWCVAERSAARLIAWVASQVGTASAAAPLDPKDLTNKLAALRASKFGATRFDLGPEL